MEQLEGCVDASNPDYVCKQQKALYGLKQAPRQWYEKINSSLIDTLGFQSSSYDPCLYIRRAEGEIVMISLYVHDLLLAASDVKLLVRLKREFCKPCIDNYRKQQQTLLV